MRINVDALNSSHALSVGDTVLFEGELSSEHYELPFKVNLLIDSEQNTQAYLWTRDLSKISNFVWVEQSATASNLRLSVKRVAGQTNWLRQQTIE